MCNLHTHHEMVAMQELIQELEESSKILTDFVKENAEQWGFRPDPSRWTMGEHMEHLWLSGLSIASVLGKDEEFFHPFQPKDISSVPAADFSQYAAMLKERGIKSPSKYSPQEGFDKTPEEFYQAWEALIDKTKKRFNANWTMERLEQNFIPHPAFNLMTVKELVAFNSYHIFHHLNIVKNEYLKSSE